MANFFRDGKLVNEPSRANIPIDVINNINTKYPSTGMDQGAPSSWGKTAYQFIKGAEGIPGAIPEVAMQLATKVIPEIATAPLRAFGYGPDEKALGERMHLKGKTLAEAVGTAKPIEGEGIGRQWFSNNPVNQALEKYLLPEGYGETKTDSDRFAYNMGTALPMAVMGFANLPAMWQASAALASSALGVSAAEKGGEYGRWAGEQVGLPETGEFFGSSLLGVLGAAAGGAAVNKGVGVKQAVSQTPGGWKKGWGESDWSKGTKPELRGGTSGKWAAAKEGFTRNSFRNHIQENIIKKYADEAELAKQNATPEWRDRQGKELWDVIQEEQMASYQNSDLKSSIGEALNDAEKFFLPEGIRTTDVEGQPLSRSQILEQFEGLKPGEKKKFLKAENESLKQQGKATKQQDQLQKQALQEGESVRKQEVKSAERVMAEEHSRKLSMEKYKEEQRVKKQKELENAHKDSIKNEKKAKEEYAKAERERKRGITGEKKTQIKEIKKKITGLKKQSRMKTHRDIRDRLLLEISEEESRIDAIRKEFSEERINNSQKWNKERLDARESREKLAKELAEFKSKNPKPLKQPKFSPTPKQTEVPSFGGRRQEIALEKPTPTPPIDEQASTRFNNKVIGIDNLEKLLRRIGHKIEITHPTDTLALGKLRRIYKAGYDMLNQAGAENPAWGKPANMSRSAAQTLYQTGLVEEAMPIILGSAIGKRAGISGLTGALLGWSGKMLGTNTGEWFKSRALDPLRYMDWVRKNPIIAGEASNLISAAAGIKYGSKALRPEYITAGRKSVKNIDSELRNIQLAKNSPHKILRGGQMITIGR